MDRYFSNLKQLCRALTAFPLGLLFFVVTGGMAASAANAQTSLFGPHVGATSTDFKQECKGDENISPTQVLWHFVLLQTADVATGTLTTQFQIQNGSAPFNTAYDKLVPPPPQTTSVIHWNVITDGDDTLLAASTDATGEQLNLSHVCRGSDLQNATYAISTVVHLGATDLGTPIVVDNCNGANAPAAVHDSAIVTGTTTNLPTTSLVGFMFWKNNACEGTPFAMSDLEDVSGQALPLSLDPRFAQTGLPPGGYSYSAALDVNGKTYPGECEPFMVYAAPLTPGYWKTHLEPSKTSKNGPFTITYLPKSLGNYVVDTTAKATAVWDAMNCGVAGSQNAIGCLAGHLLAAELNVANGSAPCINATIAAANLFLQSIGYVGPAGNYSLLSAADRATAISLKNQLDTYNNGGGCPAGSTCP